MEKAVKETKEGDKAAQRTVQNTRIAATSRESRNPSTSTPNLNSSVERFGPSGPSVDACSGSDMHISAGCTTDLIT